MARISASLCWAILALAFSATGAAARPVDYYVNQDTATIAFSTHVANVVPIDGTFRHFNGHIQFDPEKPSAIRIDVVVDDGRIEVAFGGAPTLRSASYFDHAHYPTIKFSSDSVRQLPGDHFTIAGNLTIRDVTRPQLLMGVLSRTKVGGVSAMHLVFHGQLDRTDFGLVADRSVIADKVTLTITTNLRALPALTPEF